MNYSKSSSASYRGDSGEALFIAEMIMKGHNVSIPFGHNNGYDVVVEGRNSGKMYRVQVKMTMGVTGKNGYRFGALKKYKGKVDMFAFLCVDTWYIVPPSAVNYTNVNVFTLNRKKFGDYHEKFELFV
jgi:hypothetical protein